MTRTPIDPNEIPADTGAAGLVGWIGESLARGLFLRLSALAALGGALLGGINETAPEWARLAAVIVGLVGGIALLFSQLFAWPRARQWALILGVLVVCGALLAFHFTQR